MRTRLRPEWLALALVGAVLVFVAAHLTRTVAAPVSEPRDAPPIVLIAGAPVTWSFITAQPGLSGLRFWLAQSAPAGAELVVRIVPVASPEAVLVETVVPLGTAAPDGAVTAAFAPLRIGESPHILTSTLEVQLGLLGLPPGAAISLKPGAVTEGRGPAFTAYYQIRPFDRLWPISRMADGRPGLLGWPPLYALLAYGLLVALMRGIWLAIHEGAAAQPMRH